MYLENSFQFLEKLKNVVSQLAFAKKKIWPTSETFFFANKNSVQCGQQTMRSSSFILQKKQPDMFLTRKTKKVLFSICSRMTSPQTDLTKHNLFQFILQNGMYKNF